MLLEETDEKIDGRDEAKEKRTRVIYVFLGTSYCWSNTSKIFVRNTSIFLALRRLSDNERSTHRVGFVQGR